MIWFMLIYDVRKIKKMCLGVKSAETFWRYLVFNLWIGISSNVFYYYLTALHYLRSWCQIS